MPDARANFESAVAALTRYFVGNQTLGESLHQVAELSIEALPQATHCGITLLVDGKLKTSVFTHPEIPEIDQAQYRTGDGPCIDAYRSGEGHVIHSTLQPGRWQAFRDSAAGHGVLSTLSIPLETSEGRTGALNLYSEIEGGFDNEDVQRTAELFVSQAAFVLANAQAYWDARALNENLHEAIKTRATIDQAKGIIMSAMRCNEDEAFRVLTKQSQDQNVKVRDIAVEIVRNVTGPSATHRPRSAS